MKIKILKNRLYILLMVLLIVFANVFISSLLGNNIVILGALTIGVVYAGFTHSINSVYFFILCTIMQNAVLIISASNMSRMETQAIILIKELLVYTCALIYFTRFRLTQLERLDYIFIGFLIYSAFNIIVVAPSLGSAVVGFRQYLVIFLGFYFGRSIKYRSDMEITVLYRTILAISLGVIIIGFFMLPGKKNIWEDLGYGQYWYNKTGTFEFSNVNFYTWDFGIELKRFVSIFADPLACLHFLGIPLVILYIKEGIGQKIGMKILVILTLILGMSKSSIVLIFCIFMVSFYSKIKSKTYRIFFVIFMCALSLIGILYLSHYTSSLTVATSIGNHFSSFQYGLHNMSLIGQGYGSTGFNAIMMGAEADSGYGESFLAATIGQTGLIGVLFVYMFMFVNALELLKMYRINQNKDILISLILITSLIIESFFSASAISMLGTGLYFILSGIAYNLRENRYIILKETV